MLQNNRCREIEKLSLNILSDISIQKHIVNINENSDSYAGYSFQQELKNKLLYKMFSVDNVLSIDFIANDGRQFSVGYHSVQYSPFEYSKIRKLAYDGDGSNRWAVNISASNTISSIRLIKEVERASFKPLGILVINLRLDDVMKYEPVADSPYDPDLIVMHNGDIIYSSGNIEIGSSFAYLSDKPYQIRKFGGKRYLISSKESMYTDLTFVNILQCDAVLSSVNSIIRMNIVMFIVIVISSLTIGLYFAKKISSSISTLSAWMTKVENGNYHIGHIDEKEEKNWLYIEEVEKLKNNFKTMVSRINYLINDVYKKEILIRETRYKILQQQINPHFLYNTLDTINWMAQGIGNNKISMMVTSLSHMLRSSFSDEDVTTVEKEISFLNSYIFIQKIRFEDRLEFFNNIDKKFYQLQIPKITLQPIVENSINYTLQSGSNVCKVQIESRNCKNYAEISVIDNGPGMEADFIKRLLSGQIESTKSGIGLKNIDERLKLIFGEKYGIHIESAIGEGTRVTIRLPNEGIT